MSAYDFPLLPFLIFQFLGDVRLFSFSVPRHSMEFSISSFLANSGLLKKLSVHSACPRPNKGSESSSTIAVVLGVTGVFRLDCRTVFLPVYRRKHHKYPVLDSHSSKVAMPLYHSQINSWMKCTDWKHAGQISAITENTSIATPNERLNYSLPVYRRNWHIISVLTSSWQQIWSPWASESMSRQIFQTTERSVAFVNE